MDAERSSPRLPARDEPALSGYLLTNELPVLCLGSAELLDRYVEVWERCDVD
jgi:hypothetical protein